MSRLLGNLALLVAALALSAGVAEVWLRSWSPLELGFEYRDGAFHRPLEFEPDFTTNRLGFHDLEPGLQEPDGLRILLLGDSYVAGNSVGVNQTVGQRLERHLDRDGGRDVDVVSLARAGWGQGSQLEALRELGPGLAPDLVITLFLPFNDVRNNHPPLQERGLEQLRRMQRFRPGWHRLAKQDAPLFWIESSVLNRTLSFWGAVLVGRYRDTEIPIDYLVYSRTYPPEWEAAWQETFDLLLRTREQARSLGADYCLVSASTPHGVLGPDAGLELLRRTYPGMQEGSWDLDRPDRLLEAFSQEHGVPFLALEPLFRAITADGGPRLHWKLDGHWNAEGNERAAQAIADFLRAQRLIEQP